ncbi:MAG: acyltransferase family protein, partial [Bacteroidota bacterium]
MFIYHVNMIFVAEWDWHIQDESSSNVLLESNYWMSSFRMPLLFVVSGYVSAILLERMNWKSFVNLRWKRLLIPTVVWTFILVAPQIYFERLLEGVEFSYSEFYPSFLKFEWYPEG